MGATVANKIHTDKITRSIGKYILISIGIDSYSNNKPLYNCENDANAVNDVFMDSQYLNLQKNGSHILLSRNDETTKQIILEKISNILSNVNEHTNIFFYFSGHGCTKNDNFYFILSDSDKSIE